MDDDGPAIRRSDDYDSYYRLLMQPRRRPGNVQTCIFCGVHLQGRECPVRPPVDTSETPER